jgi:hypothetical protein
MQGSISNNHFADVAGICHASAGALKFATCSGKDLNYESNNPLAR